MSKSRFLFTAVAVIVFAISGFGQPDLQKLRADAFGLMDAQRYTEALPLLEQVAAAMPRDSAVLRQLAFAFLGQATNTADPAVAKALRARARSSFVRARDAGDDSQLVSAMIDSIPPDGGDGSTFTLDKQAQELMQKGEASFTSGKLDDALDMYQQAFKLDPKLYHAALFSGDVYLHKQKYDEAEAWYQKAIAIDPDIETAYRYSATPLMRQGKFEKARDRYVEAWITEPYNKLAVSGLIQWGQTTRTRLSHPKLDIPQTKTGPDGKENTTINVNPLADDDSMAWIAYSATRAGWKKERFARAFPGEKAYRHTLAEEADALRSVVSMAKTLKAKKPSSQIALIEKMDKEGVLEAFVLMAVPDRDIAADHPAYLRTNRDKLRKYVLDYVIEKK